MVPMAFGWSQPSTAAMTVMLIASASGLNESISKGVIRTIGTIIGAIVGLTLIAIFPQERVLYLLSLSIILALIIYFYYAYRGDSSVFLLAAMVIMMIFLHGPQNAFLYGVDRTYMTLFGIVVYTFVGIFLWPQKKEELNEAESIENFETPEHKSSFIFLDPDNFKATLQLLAVFWSSTLFWIYFNPPGGFLLVILATLLGLFTTFSPLKPTLLMTLLSFGFLFATAMYVFVLPNLVYAWQLALFIFIYTFIAFYFLPPKTTIFFLIGMFLLGIDNTMQYNFALFLNILLVFYLFLIILMLFHNFPFSTQPEHLYLKLKERFFKHLESLENAQTTRAKRHHNFHLHLIVKKMQALSKRVASQELDKFSKACEEFLKKSDKEKKSIILNLNQSINWSHLEAEKF